MGKQNIYNKENVKNIHYVPYIRKTYNFIKSTEISLKNCHN